MCLGSAQTIKLTPTSDIRPMETHTAILQFVNTHFSDRTTDWVVDFVNQFASNADQVLFTNAHARLSAHAWIGVTHEIAMQLYTLFHATEGSPTGLEYETIHHMLCESCFSRVDALTRTTTPPDVDVVEGLRDHERAQGQIHWTTLLKKATQ